MSKDWSNNLPPWSSQVAVKSRVDAQDCINEAFINAIYMLTGLDGSPRAGAKLSGTTQTGNSVSNVVAAFNKYGIIPYPLWPSPADFDWGTYYENIPTSILKQAIRCHIELVPPNLDGSPILTELAWGLNLPIPTRHLVAQINKTEYFDSELGSPVKPLNYEGATIVYQTSIKITLMISAKIVRFVDNKTMGIMIDTPNGTQIIKATDEAQFRSWNSPTSYGKPTVNPDGSTNWNCVEIQLNF